MKRVWRSMAQAARPRRKKPAPRDVVEFSCRTREYRDTLGILFPRGIVKRVGLQAGKKVKISLEA